MDKSLHLHKERLYEPVSIVAHQLKNPLSVIKSYLEVIASGAIGSMNAQQKEYIGDVLSNVNRMTKIISKLLDISRIEENRYVLRSEKINLSHYTQEVIDDLAHWAQANGSRIQFFPPQKDLYIKTDPLKIKDVIENFISNAVKYNTSGKAVVEVFIRSTNGNVQFQCKDSGIGIAKKDFKKVFRKFYRSERALLLDSAGTGLGLYINRAIIEKNGGKIWFEKNKGRGMSFYFTLPRAR